MKQFSFMMFLVVAASLLCGRAVEAQRFLQESTDAIMCYANTDQDGSGTDTIPITDADGHLQIDVLSGGGGGTQYSVDDVSGGTDTGTACLVVRDDSLSTLTPADGDYTTLRVSSTGALHVTGGGGGTEYTEDVATADPQVGTATMMERDDALSTVTPIEGDWIGLRGSAEGALWTQDFNSDAILADTASMDTNLTTVAGAVSAGQVQVDIVADGAGLCLDASVDGVEGLLTTIDADTSSMATNLGTIDTDTGNIATSVATIDNAIHVDDAAFTLGSGSGAMMMAFAGTQSVNSGDAGALRMDTDGALHISDGSNVISVDDAAGSLTVDGTLTCNAGTNLNTSALALDASVDGVEALLTTIDADTGGILADTAAIQTAVETIDNIVSGSEAQVDVVAALPAGTNLIGDVNIQSSSTSGDGASAYLDADCDNTAQSVKAGSGNLKGWYISNANTTVACVQIFNIASGSVTVGTSTPTLSLCIPPDDAAANVMTEPGIGFGTQISVACTTTATGSTDPTTGLVVNLVYE